MLVRLHHPTALLSAVLCVEISNLRHTSCIRVGIMVSPGDEGATQILVPSGVRSTSIGTFYCMDTSGARIEAGLTYGLVPSEILG